MGSREPRFRLIVLPSNEPGNLSNQPPERASLKAFGGFPQEFGSDLASDSVQRKSFPLAAIPTRLGNFPARVFSRLRVAARMLCTKTDEVARNGALQRKNFGQRFSWAPLAFLASASARSSLPRPNTAPPHPPTDGLFRTVGRHDSP